MKKRKNIGKIIVFLILFFLTPILSSFTVNLARVQREPKLIEDLSAFREMKIETERLNGYEKWSEQEYTRLAIDYLYATGTNKKMEAVSKLSWYYLLLPKEKVDDYRKGFQIIFSDMNCFPVGKDEKKKATVKYEDSWGKSRNYGGKRIHEGTDIMSSNNVRGYFPVISVCDGRVEKKGWLNLGGYRLGIRGTHGAYFYYAHLEKYAEGVEEGTYVKEGQIIGYMGDSGYGTEGTVGKFDVHLHFGIYIPLKRNGKTEDVSINPYVALKAVQQREK